MIRFAWIKGASFSQYEFSLLCDAVGLANKAVNTEDFRRFLKELNEPKISTAFGPTNVIQMSVSKYSPWNPFTSAVAHAQDGVIYLNKRAFKRGVVVQALAQANGNRSEAARQLKVLRASLVRILRKHGIK